MRIRPSSVGWGSGETGGGTEGASASTPQSSLFMCPILLMSPLNVLFLKAVANNVHGNQQAKSQGN